MHDKLDFYDLVHELRYGKARHSPPAVMRSALASASSNSATDMTSTQKRAKRKAAMTLAELDERNNKLHEQLFGELQKENEHKATFKELFRSFIEKT